MGIRRQITTDNVSSEASFLSCQKSADDVKSRNLTKGPRQLQKWVYLLSPKTLFCGCHFYVLRRHHFQHNFFSKIIFQEKKNENVTRQNEKQLL